MSNQTITLNHVKEQLNEEIAILQDGLSVATNDTTESLRISYEESLVIDILKDKSVQKEIHTEFLNGKRSIKDEGSISNELLGSLMYIKNETDNYLTLYKNAIKRFTEQYD